MGARLGSPDEAVYESPQPALLQSVTGIQPPGTGTHVRLDEEFGVKTMQRLAIGNLGGRVTVLLWPAELKPQALRLYTDRRGEALLAEARRLGWRARPTPHVAFHTAPASRRLYLHTEVGVDEYVRRWQGADFRWIGQHSPVEVRTVLWPWLQSRGYATPADDQVLESFLKLLGRRPAHLRPGLRLAREWDRETAARLSRHELAAEIRADVNALLASVGEPRIPF